MPREVGGVGKWGEDRAVEFLQRQRFDIVERNFNCTVGEIDIVAKKGDDFYFIEVKTRSLGPFSNDLALTFQKKQKIKKTVSRYCNQRSVRDCGLVLASLLVVVDRRAKKVNFRLSVLY
jgi:putative endonuclease